MKRMPRHRLVVIATLALAFLNADLASAQQDELVEAEALLREVVQQRFEILGAEHPETLRARRRLAEVLSARARHPESIAQLRAILGIQREALGTNDLETLRTQEALAVALLRSATSNTEEVAVLRPLSLRRDGLSKTDETTRRIAPDQRFPGRFGGRRGRKGGYSQTEKAVDLGLDWLARHQAPDGRWDADGFANQCTHGACTGDGSPINDNGLTGLALLAFLGAGNTTMAGDYRKNVLNGIQHLTRAQDPDQGIFGAKVGQHYMYNHAIASLAMTEAYHLTGLHPLLRDPAQRAVDFILRSRNPYKAWRYESPPNGENDTSVTGWMVMVLESAREAGLDVDMAAFDGALAWIDEMTNMETGRTGYLTQGGLSAREAGMETEFPNDKTEAMTAVAMLSRIFLGQGGDHPTVRLGAQRLRDMPPKWNPEGGEADMYYWYYGAYAMFQLGGRNWNIWNEAMKDAVLPHQHQEEGCIRGSWDPIGPWGEAGGRVYSTALMVLCLEVYYRYGKVIGSRGEKKGK